MKRQEYKLLIENWNTFLIEEEKRLINEQLLVESLLLNEDWANKFRKLPKIRQTIGAILLTAKILGISSSVLAADIAENGVEAFDPQVKAGIERVENHVGIDLDDDDLVNAANELVNNGDLQDQEEEAMMNLVQDAEGDENEVLRSASTEEIDAKKVLADIESEISKVSQEKINDFKMKLHTTSGMSDALKDPGSIDVSEIGDTELRNMVSGIKIMLLQGLMQDSEFKDNLGKLISVASTAEGTIGGEDYSIETHGDIGSESSRTIGFLLDAGIEVEDLHFKSGDFKQIVKGVKESLKYSGLSGTETGNRFLKLFTKGLFRLSRNEEFGKVGTPFKTVSPDTKRLVKSLTLSATAMK